MKKIFKLIVFFTIALVLLIGAYMKFNKPSSANILLLGVDAGDYEHKQAPKRSDTIMVLNLDTNNKNVYMYSIPRDTLVHVNGENSKINAVHAIGGVELIKNKIESMLNIKIDYYVKVDYSAFKELVDAVGGVDVVVPFDMNYDASDIKIHFKKGEKVHLNGEKAEQFVRWRKNNDGTGYALGDLGRISTQQEFIIKASQKLKSPLIIFRLPKILKVVSSNIKTDLSTTKIVNYAFVFYGIDKNNIENKIMSGEPKYINSISYFIANVSNDREYLNHYRLNNKSVEAESKDDITIKIYNSTNVNGLAARYKKTLEQNGYKITEIGNYNKRVKTTIINCKEQNLADDIKQIIGVGTIKPSENLNQKEVVVILGSDSVK
ncbi:MAG: LCP family protein [Clostridiales bacterium]|nr:LCP family protein [Clostridiales bacterium]